MTGLLFHAKTRPCLIARVIATEIRACFFLFEAVMSSALLHGYFRSSTAFRVRLALNLKRIAYDQHFRHLRKGEQRAPDYLALNPQGLVPTLEIDDHILTQSLAIIEYIDETHPTPPLLPADALGRARVRSLAYMVACEIHPINNLRVLQDLSRRFGATDSAVADWFRHWTAETFAPLEYRLAHEADTGRFCHGDKPGLADIVLVPQIINNLRFQVDMTAYPTINRIGQACLELEAFKAALPQNQPDAE
jgi:maleylpyruvate isomerase